MDFGQIRYFLALAETLNFTRAAEKCHVTQPTLTQAIKRLEEELGGPLVFRDGRNTRLTTLGNALRNHFQKIDETKKALRETASAITSGEQIELNIGIMCTIGPTMLSRFLERFQVEHPNAKVMLHDVTLDAIPNLLLSGALDGCFCARHTDPHDKLDYSALFQEEMVVACSKNHPFALRESVSLNEVNGERYLDRLLCEFRDEFNQFFRERDLMPDIAFTSQREDWIQSMVRDGFGISILPKYSIISPELRCCRITDPLLERNVECATVYGGHKSPGLRAMTDKIKRYDWKQLVAETETKIESGGL